MAAFFPNAVVEPGEGAMGAGGIGGKGLSVGGRDGKAGGGGDGVLVGGEEAFSVRATGIVEADARLFGALSDAILQRREVDFGYLKLTGDAPERRRVRPYHLGQVDHGWYLFGYDLDREAVRTFALPRISDHAVTTTTFDRPTDFNLRNHLGGSFGVWNYPEVESGDQDVRVVFRGYAARVVAERRWHPSQEIAPWGGDGGQSSCG